MAKIKIGVDSISISGPKIDGTWIIKLETGEYEKYRVLELAKLTPPVFVIIEGNGNKRQTSNKKRNLT